MQAREPKGVDVSTLNPDAPSGWDSNPSAWRERGPLLALAAVGLLISAVLAAYQFGLLPEPWDPVFGPASSARVLHSPISRLLPVPDASLGVLGYAAEIVLGVIGRRTRWRTLPGAVLLFGLVVLGLGVVSMLLLILQGAVVHSWCLLCLASAAISIFILSMEPGEALAAAQQVKRTHASGAGWRSALLGIQQKPSDEVAGAPMPEDASYQRDATAREMLDFSMWAQVASLVLGVWLLIAPGALGYGDPARTVERAIGPVVIVVSALALRRVTRPVRYLNLLAGLALLLAPWVFDYTSVPAIVNSDLVGMALLGLALAGRRVAGQWAGGWRSLVEKPAALNLPQGR